MSAHVTEWRLQILSKEGIPEMASITGRGAQSLIPLEILAASANLPAGATQISAARLFISASFKNTPIMLSNFQKLDVHPNPCLWTVEGILGENLQGGFKSGTLLLGDQPLRQIFNI